MLLVLLVTCLCWAFAGGVRSITVPRCCPTGERLVEDLLRRQRLDLDEVTCELDPSDRDGWRPRVYAPLRQMFLPEFPQHLRLSDIPTRPQCSPLRVVTEHVAGYAILANNGSITMRDSTRAFALPGSRFCVDPGAALLCLEDAPPPPSKCCARGRVYDGSSCVQDEERAQEALLELVHFVNESAVSVGWPSCGNLSQYAVSGALSDARLEEDGLKLGSQKIEAGAWCAEALAGDESGARVLTCARDAETSVPPVRHVVYGVVLAIGSLFLLATLAASLALPAAHHALHWRCQTHYVGALMLGNMLLAAAQLAGGAVALPLCRAIAVAMHFLFLAAFFWLNTMCFNIWWTFRDFRPSGVERGQERWRLRVYSVYAWGGPLALAGAAALLDALPPGAAPTLLRPRFAQTRCWFYGDSEILVYFFGPVGVLLLVNLALFVSTTRQLTCGLWTRDEVKSTSERAALGRVCTKLVVVMGVTWGADVVSWAAGGPDYVWYVTDLLNALQGLLIFLVVGCQPHAWAALKRLIKKLLCCIRQDPTPPTNSTTHMPSCGESMTHTTNAGAQNNSTSPASTAPPAPIKVPMETVC